MRPGAGVRTQFGGGGDAGGRVHLTLAVLGAHFRNDLGVHGLVRALLKRQRVKQHVTCDMWHV